MQFRTNVQVSEQEVAINKYLKSIHVDYNALYFGETKKDGWTCDKWVVSFFRNRGSMEKEFFTGTGHRGAESPVPRYVKINPRTIDSVRWIERNVKPIKPQAASVIYSLLLESSVTEYTFASWCNEFGYDTDSRKALALYEQCQIVADEFVALFSKEERATLARLIEDY